MIILPPPIGIPFVPFIGYGDEERRSSTGWIVLLAAGWLVWQVVKDDLRAAR